MKINTRIQFTNDEKELMSVIKDVIKKYTPSTQAFLVGGIVRDKLLGIQSNDIDIMLSDISGENFAKLVTKHLEIKDPHVIQANPEASKNITTAKAYIQLSSGTVQEVDFAQAREDVYSDKSRIPTLKPATPQLDSFRRDLTINSIFYDISNEKIVDFTGRGISDLQNNIIRTPQDPIKTFKDDPLRIFRVVRFAAKYNGKIDPETYQAMLDPSLRDEIKKKVSKERIGTEITKMLSNPNAEYAIALLKDTGLFQDILNESLKGTDYEGKIHPTLDMDQQNPHHTLNLWEHTMEVVKHVIEKYKDADPERRVVMILSALMHDLGKLCYKIHGKSEQGHTSYHGHEDESAKIVPYILRYLKMDPYIKEVSQLVSNHMKLHHRERDSAHLRSLRRFIREMGEKSLNWLDIFNLSVADAYAKDKSVDVETVRRYQELENKLQEALSTMGAFQGTSKKVIPILNGNEIMDAFNNKKPGPWVKTVTNWLLSLQDQEPNISKEDAKKQMLENFPEYIDKIITASKCSSILIEKTNERINEIIRQRPTEAISIAKDLMEQYDDDEDVVFLCLNTFIYAKKTDEKSQIGNDIIQKAKEIADKNFLVPNIILAYVIAYVLSEKKMDEECKRFLLRAYKMDKWKTVKNIKDILGIIRNNDNKKILEKFTK